MFADESKLYAEFRSVGSAQRITCRSECNVRQMPIEF